MLKLRMYFESYLNLVEAVEAVDDVDCGLLLGGEDDVDCASRVVVVRRFEADTAKERRVDDRA